VPEHRATRLQHAPLTLAAGDDRVEAEVVDEDGDPRQGVGVVEASPTAARPSVPGRWARSSRSW